MHKLSATAERYYDFAQYHSVLMHTMLCCLQCAQLISDWRGAKLSVKICQRYWRKFITTVDMCSAYGVIRGTCVEVETC